MRIILLGSPGSGKGTQATRIIEAFDIAHLSTGEMLRAQVRANTETGKRASEVMKGGGLVPDQLILEIVEERIAQPDCRNGFVLDGFPRTIAQAEALDDHLRTEKLDLDHVIELKVAEEILLDRVMARAEQAKRHGHTMRADDNRDALKIRLDAYNQEAAPLIEYYRSKQVLWTIDGLRPINAATQDIFNALKN
jgi:adenylate kinase